MRSPRPRRRTQRSSAMAARIEAACRARSSKPTARIVEAARSKGRDAAFHRPAQRSTGAASRRWRRGLREIAALADPVGEVMARWTRPNGLEISRVRVPLGVIGIIYESRPNVTADAAGALPEIGQRGDPAQRLGELSHLARHRQCLERGGGEPQGCPRPRSSSCRRSIARRWASCSAGLAAPST